MALPNQIDPNTPLGSAAASTADDQLRALKQFLIDVFGLPNATNITAAVTTINTAGALTVGLTFDLAADGNVLVAKRAGTIVWSLYADDAESKLLVKDSGGVTRLAFDMATGAMAAGVVPLARMQVDSKEGSSFTSWTTAAVTYITFGSVTVVAGDIVEVSFNALCTGGASSGSAQLFVAKASGGATLNLITSAGLPLDALGYIVWEVPTLGGSLTAYNTSVIKLYASVGGTAVITLRASISSQNAVASQIYARLQVLRGI
jgi:hypothetical protein